MDAAVLALALALDWAWGEPPARFHPVAWLGRLISLQDRLAPRSGAGAQVAYGAAMVVLDVALFALPLYYLLGYLAAAAPLAYVIVGALWLKIAFSLRLLRGAASGIPKLLLADKMDEARFNLRSLVSRDTNSLDKPHLASATIESVAENTGDSFVAPLFYFLILGVPGAIGYRVANTLDAMVGYHGRYEYLGKAAARLDDVLNYIPARLTALLLMLSAFLTKKDGANAWRILRRDHGRTESPNAGWPMSAMAGALDIWLEKVGHYKLGGEHSPPSVEKIDASLQLMLASAIIWSVICLAIAVVPFAY